VAVTEYAVQRYHRQQDLWLTVCLFDTEEGADAYAWRQALCWHEQYRVVPVRK
jgi:hypothetical protein